MRPPVIFYGLKSQSKLDIVQEQGWNVCLLIKYNQDSKSKHRIKSVWFKSKNWRSWHVDIILKKRKEIRTCTSDHTGAGWRRNRRFAPNYILILPFFSPSSRSLCNLSLMLSFRPDRYAPFQVQSTEHHWLATATRIPQNRKDLQWLNCTHCISLWCYKSYGSCGLLRLQHRSCSV